MGTFQKTTLFIICLGMLIGSISAQADDSLQSVDSLGIQIKPQLKIKSPLISGSISAVVPGGGQFYTGRYVKAGAFLALEAITGLVANYWYKESQVRYDRAAEFQKEVLINKYQMKIIEDTLKHIQDRFDDEYELQKDTLYARLDSLFKGKLYTLFKEKEINEEVEALARFDARLARYTMYNALSVMIGGYLYNILDAIDGTHFFDDDKERNPRRAALLSAIPGLGLGQLYNGSLSKAGMIMMTQFSLSVKVFNEQRLQSIANDAYHKTLRIKDSADVTFVTDEFGKDWEGRRDTAFKNRNMFLWYSVFFYFYGIIDAMVDAHLHDYPRKMRTYPDLMPELQAFRLNFDYFF